MQGSGLCAVSEVAGLYFVTPAESVVQDIEKMDARFRGNDGDENTLFLGRVSSQRYLSRN